ncbi:MULTISPECIES: GNAT family N-acetyltransferase [unclassified Coleofasciculus]|uniref:GNAT family N-acetyltransferase n=1 Tax=unclassified Coleofasciculus TaxID=2692782 RepID=UPI00187FA715|nr:MULTISPECIES: GNAT family N-acetyltransferase [unclassified Coleofasciculus]MBE9128674.1 GNAT family N-acetyltransferase [Coleofasciculus sp. LEGE 07081]MBE9147156.1 GNAT family N-acetyltransferase [Coleofasciculus sp. LEGE 07092]
MDIQIGQESDIPELANLYQQTVLAIAPQWYSPAQTQRWASFPSDIASFRQFILQGTTFIATDEMEILGFAGITEDGHVTSAYVRSDRIHQGIGSTLMETLLDYAKNHNIQRLYAEASEFSLGLFKKFSFHIYDTEVVERQGVQFKRYLVERSL